jgi:phosphoribosylanthranilate isomerase
MFRIKICGITNPADAQAAASAGADAIGLNFYSNSKRFIDHETARQICAALPTGVMRVGIFVNHSVGEIQKAIDCVGFDCIQLHGDEPPPFLGKLPISLNVIRAVRYGRDGLRRIKTYLDECRDLGRVPDAILLDSNASAEFGGTGRAADWRRIAAERDMLGMMPVILAGGLTPDNVAEGIRMVRPSAVDVASGVESAPGRKDHARMRDFVAAARAAFS